MIGFFYDLEMTIRGKYPNWTVKIWSNWERRAIRPYSKKDIAEYKEVYRDSESTMEVHCDTNNDFLLITVTNPKYGVYVFKMQGKNYEEFYERYLRNYNEWVKLSTARDCYTFSKV